MHWDFVYFEVRDLDNQMVIGKKLHIYIKIKSRTFKIQFKFLIKDM